MGAPPLSPSSNCTCGLPSLVVSKRHAPLAILAPLPFPPAEVAVGFQKAAHARDALLRLTPEKLILTLAPVAVDPSSRTWADVQQVRPGQAPALTCRP